jgi:hypothetical protein
MLRWILRRHAACLDATSIMSMHAHVENEVERSKSRKLMLDLFEWGSNSLIWLARAHGQVIHVEVKSTVDDC